MKRILHVVSQKHHQTEVIVSQLARFPSECVEVICVGTEEHQWCERLNSVRTGKLRTCDGVLFSGTVQLGKRLRTFRPDLIHAWDLGTVRAIVASKSRGTQLVANYWGSGMESMSRKGIALLRDHDAACVCHSEWTRQELLRVGVDHERCVLVRPAVDFTLLRGALAGQSTLNRGSSMRDVRNPRILFPCGLGSASNPLLGLACLELIVSRHRPLEAVIPEPVCMQRALDQYRQIRQAIGLDLKIVTSDEPISRLAPCSDFAMVPFSGSVDTTQLAWVLAAGVPTVAVADYGITEYIVHRVNGYLVRVAEAIPLSRGILHLLQSPDDARRWGDVARAQAYQSFGLTRYLQQLDGIYENVLSGNPPGLGIEDSARDFARHST